MPEAAKPANLSSSAELTEDPIIETARLDGGQPAFTDTGLTQRVYIAVEIAKALITRGGFPVNADVIAREAFKLADAILVESVR